MVKTAVVLNDLQMEYHDVEVLTELVIPFVKDIKPDILILNGDIVDMYALSTFDKQPSTKPDILGEIESARWLMKQLEHVPTKHWIGGNHEHRLDRYLWKQAPALGLDRAAFPRRFGLPDFDFKWHPYNGDEPGHVMLGKLMVTHGFLVRAHSAISAKAHLERLGSSVLVGHTHRMGVHYKTNVKGVHAAYENGCLCRLDPEYAQYPDWQQGFSVVHVHDHNGFFNVQQIPILERRVFHYGPEVYERNRRDRKRA